MDVAVWCDAQETVYAASIVSRPLEIDLPLSPPMGGGDIARLRELDPVEIFEVLDFVDP